MNCLDRREIFSQLPARCGQACIVFSYALLRHKNLSRKEFIALEANVYNAIFQQGFHQSPATLEELAVGALEIGLVAKVIPLRPFTMSSPAVLVARVRWSSFLSQDRLRHFMYDEEHYVAVTEWRNRCFKFWEPSFGWSGKRDAPAIDEEKHLGIGSPWWKMSEDAFLARNSNTVVSDGKALLLQ